MKEIRAILSEYHALIAAAENGDYGAMDTLIDLMTALERARLTAKQRTAVHTVYMRDMTQKDAAQALGLSEIGLKTLLARAIRKLEQAKGAK